MSRLDDIGARFEAQLEESVRDTDFHSLGGGRRELPTGFVRWLVETHTKADLAAVIAHLVRSRKWAEDKRKLAEGRRDWLEAVHSEGPWWSLVEGVERMCGSVATAAREKRHEALDRRRQEQA